MQVGAVAFDLDDTLAVPERDRASLLREALLAAGGPGVAEDLGRPAYVDAHTRNAASDTREPIFADLLADHDADPARAAETYRRKLAEALVPVHGAGPLLADLRREYPLGLLTDGPPRAQRDKLDALGWNDLFDAVVVTGDIGTRKPDPDTFEALLAGLGTTPGETVYVGDHVERDVHGAADAGLRTVQVLGPVAEPDERADAHVRRDELATELPRVLAEPE
jgi:putative hydrolase of the HAD superfamily